MITQRTFLKLLMTTPLALGLPVGAEAPLIDWADERQTMDGFGASAAFHMAHNLQQFERSAEILDLLFSTEKGAGLSIVRNVVGDGGTWGEASNGPTPSIEPREGVWNWKGDEDQIWFMREAAKRGALRNMSTVWSPPAWMKTNASVTDGGMLRPDKYRAFAEYLSAYVRGYKEHHNIDIYAISPANEPDQNTKYSSCLWSGDQFHVFVRNHVVPVFARDNVQAKFLMGENSLWSEVPLLESLADPISATRIDIAASHAYARKNRSLEPLEWHTGNLRHVNASGKPLWQTEVSLFDKNDVTIDDALYWARMLHTHVAENNVSAWLYWWAIEPYDNRSALIQFDSKANRIIAAKRLFAMGNYSRFVRPGFKRIATGTAPEGVYLSAFQNEKTKVVVAINENGYNSGTALSFTAPAATAACYRTSQSEDLARIADLPAAKGVFTATLAPRSITSFVL
jgi:glucuronoarabinoxylan endo-1,4-beta-xylanase